jgi:hypothetical protein
MSRFEKQFMEIGREKEIFFREERETLRER